MIVNFGRRKVVQNVSGQLSIYIPKSLYQSASIKKGEVLEITYDRETKVIHLKRLDSNFKIIED